MPECWGTQLISVTMPWARRIQALLLVLLLSRCRGLGSICAACAIADSESLQTATVFTPCFCNVCFFSITTSWVSPIAHSWESKTSIHPVPRILPQDIHSFTCFHTAAAHPRPPSKRDPSLHHIQTPAPIFASISVALHCVGLLAVVVLS